jgi:predicted ATPase/class 3 adenylate cyclase
VRQLPTGTVTLLFTDIEGSTRLLQELGRERYVRALTEHRALLREAFAAHGGVEVEMQGDSFHFAFVSARDAVAAATAGQRALAQHGWEAEPIRVRMGLHTGEPVQADGLYAGLDVHTAARVMSAGHGGQVLVSERTADVAAPNLPAGVALRELGEHRLKDIPVPQRLHDLVVDGLEAVFPPLRASGSRPANLPVPPTPLIGRERELRELERLARSSRLVTIVGPGGIGKTRLALAACERLHANFEHGVRFVQLASLADPALVPSTVAREFEAEERPEEELLETLARVLQERELLLCLDNFEQLLAAAPFVGDLLSRCPGLRLLVTSRSPLRLAAEQEYLLPPLEEDEAMLLFAHRARASVPDFSVGEHAEAVLAICDRLDRLPLALELAAARIRLLSPPALLERLDRRLQLLTGGARDLPERQQTLRAAIDWSYHLLDRDEQRLFRRLSVFAGGFNLEAAAAVAQEDELALLDRLTALVQHSLVRRRSGAGADGRFFLLETIREYASERLEHAGEARDTRRAHADFFLRFAEPAVLSIQHPDVLAWLPAGERERANLRSALAWLIDHDTADRALQLAHRMSALWYHHGPLQEGTELLERALGRSGGDARLRAQALRGAGRLEYARGRYPEARRIFSESTLLWQELDAPEEVARELSNFGAVAHHDGDLAAAQEAFVEALELARQLGEKPVQSAVLSNLGLVTKESGDLRSARAFYEESRRIDREVGDEYGLGIGTLNLGNLAGEEGQVEEASRHLVSALHAFRKLDVAEGVVACLESLAVLAVEQEQPRRGAVLLAVCDQQREQLGGVVPGIDRDRIEHFRELIHERLDPEELSVAQARGRSLSLEEGVDFALEDAAVGTMEGGVQPG